MKRRIKQLLAGLLALALMLSVVPLAVMAGAEETDTVIASYEDLMAFADAVRDGDTFEGRTVTLTVNVYLGGESNPWTAIGTSATPFRGIFDGGYHVVSGLYSSVGFFGNVNGGTVKNLVVRGEVKGSSNVAGVVGKLTAGTVRNCGNEADVSGGANVGGVVGSVNGNCTVSGCYNKGAVTGTTGYIGGVTGQHWRAGVVENCYNAGTVTGPATVGGVTGGHKAASPVLNNCYNAGKMVDSAGSGNNIGAVLGASRGSNTNCYYIRETGTDSKSGVTEAETLTAAMLGDAFADGGSLPVLAWEVSVCTDSPVRPAFAEGSERSAQLAAYIRAAVKSAKTKGGIGGSLLGNETYLSGASSTATDWMALAMGRFGYADDAYVYMIDDGTGYTDYLAAMRTYIEQTYAANNGVLHSVKATEWHRAVVAIAALGGDPTNFGTYNGQPINLIADGSYNCALREGPGTQGLNGWIWGLIAMDTVRAEVPENAKYPRARFITEILRMQLTDGVNGNAFGGWVLGGYGTQSDVDMTAMAIQALAPYYNDDTVYTYTNGNSETEVSATVRECVDAALDVLGKKQNENGGYTSWGTDNAESVAQVIVALCSLGIDPVKDERFVTAEGKTLLDGLLAFRLPEGGFCHTAGGGWNSMANDQSTYALVSYWRFENRLRALYDMRGEMTGTDSEAVAAAETAIAAAKDPMAAGYKAGLKAALAACRAVPEAERRYIRGYAALAEAIATVGGEAELDTDKPFAVSVSVTKAPDRIRYTEGDGFDPTGLVITATYSDGRTEPVTDYRLSAPEKLTVADTTVTVFYGALRTTFAIEVTERTPWGGSGTAEDPYRIGTAEELAALGEKVAKGNPYTDVTFVLTANIDLSDYPDWKPIGKDSAQFDGIFDGRGYAIDNLYSKNGGLFGTVCRNAVIRNVGVASGRIGSENLSFMGAIAKWSNGADFINCWNGADILCSGWSGGIVGTVRDGGESVIKGCYNIGSVTARDGAVGGIVGHLAAGNNGTAVAVTVSDCYNAGTVTAGDNAGGIVGRVQDGNVIRNCYNIGAVTVNGENILDGAGGIVSLLTSGSTVENCYYDSALTAHGVSNGIDAAGDRTAEELKSAAFLARLGEGFKQDRYALENGGYPLLAWQATDAADEADAVTAQIAALGEVTLESETAIRAAREAYEALNEEQKVCVSGFDLLTAAEARLNELKDAGNPEPEKPEPEKPEPEKPEPEKPDDGESKASDKTVSTMLLAILVGETVILILLAAGVVMLLGSVRKHKDNFWN